MFTSYLGTLINLQLRNQLTAHGLTILGCVFVDVVTGDIVNEDGQDFFRPSSGTVLFHVSTVYMRSIWRPAGLLFLTCQTLRLHTRSEGVRQWDKGYAEPWNMNAAPLYYLFLICNFFYTSCWILLPIVSCVIISLRALTLTDFNGPIINLFILFPLVEGVGVFSEVCWFESHLS